MAVEIERKFLVRDEGWRDAALGPPLVLRQGYIAAGNGTGMTVRVRLADDAGFLTLKGPGLAAREEYEYRIPAEDAQALLARHCAAPILEKRRTRVGHAGLVWEVDEFAGRLEGLVLAEVELAAVGQPVALPEWAGEEVTGDPRFQNTALARADAVPRR